MINLTHPELAELSTTSLPRASLETLETLRNQACQASKGSFSLQPQQKFLRRVLSPDSPTRNLLMVHGTGSGKTCTAIQIAEEYIIRPEFQDKKVMVVASRAVQENFKTQIFDMSRVPKPGNSNILLSKQCTGRRYLDMLLRIESEPKNWNDPSVRTRLEKTADRIINEFYEFSGYTSFGNRLNEKLTGTEKDIDIKWVHENFDNRLLIIDEAHNIREPTDINPSGIKGITEAMTNLVKYADGLVLVLLTATPMFDSFEEIVYYMNLFMWNDRTQPFTTKIKTSDFFNADATLKPSKEEDFRKWVQTYVSYVKGDNPFTFPFRLPPPNPAPDNLKIGFDGKEIAKNDRFKYLSVIASEVQGAQKDTLTSKQGRAVMIPTIAVLPGNKEFRQVFTNVGKEQMTYVDKKNKFLKPESLANYSAKFASIIQSIEKSEGLVLVYSNYAEMGAHLFAMALEESGFSPVVGNTILAESGGNKGNYLLLTEKLSDKTLNSAMEMIKAEDNKDGKKIRVIITSPVGSEGIDFRFVRQVHIIDPWWNMSRTEQVIGRGLRTCSHQLLPFEKQNCTVYLHVVRNGDQECFDENTYRTKVESKAMRIARVRRVLEESAMDCPLQNQVNNLPADWKELEIPQIRSENEERVQYTLVSMLAPTFSDSPDVSSCKVKVGTPEEHTRPLSAYLDARDEVLNKLSALFIDKPIWERSELLGSLKHISEDVVIYTLQNAITSGFKFQDSFGRPSFLESKGDLYALAPIGVPNSTLVERTVNPSAAKPVDVPKFEKKEEYVAPADAIDLEAMIPKLPEYITSRFSVDILKRYTFDHVLNKNQKRDYLRAHPDFEPQLLVPNTNILVLGDNVYDPPEEPIGADRTRLDDWKAQLIKRFTSNRTKLYASLNSAGKLTISKMREDGTRNINKTDKFYRPTTCGTGENSKPHVYAMSKLIDSQGVGITEAKNIGSGWCLYMELLVREQHNSVWITPEELAVLYSKENESKVSKAFKNENNL